MALKKDKSTQSDCLEIVFGSDHADPGRNVSDLGFVLFERHGEHAFVLRGLKVAENARGSGLSKTFVALWLQLCTEVGVRPLTRYFIPLDRSSKTRH